MTEIFKDVSELEEFFKNLGIEYRFSCYHEKNSEGIDH
jgi:predicted enzyme involved in methoxymalonyl-ACP biosynthesis